MSTAILQEALSFDFETGLLTYTASPARFPGVSPSGEPTGGEYGEEDRQADVALCKSYFFRWASAYGSDQPAAQPITFEEFQAAAKRLAR